LLDFIYIGRDITARKRAAAEMSKALAQEKELNELKSRFIDLAFHEFRNPLASIFLTIDLLKLNAEPSQQEYFNFIKQAAKQMQFLLEDILVLGKAEGGKFVFKPVPLNLEHFCGKLVAQMQLTARESKLRVHCGGDCAPACMDEKLLQLLLTNLIANGLKYSPRNCDGESQSGSTVDLTLDCNQEEGKAKFTVKDRGIGISPKDQKLLFQSFHRGGKM